MLRTTTKGGWRPNDAAIRNRFENRTAGQLSATGHGYGIPQEMLERSRPKHLRRNTFRSKVAVKSRLREETAEPDGKRRAGNLPEHLGNEF